MDVGTVRERGDGQGHGETTQSWDARRMGIIRGYWDNRREHGDGWDMQGSSGNIGTVWGREEGHGEDAAVTAGVTQGARG